MQPRNLLVVDPVAVLDAEAEAEAIVELAELDGLVVDEALDELLPQAASSRHVLAAAAAAINAVCLTVCLQWARVAGVRHNGVIPPHRLPGDYFVSVSTDRGQTGLRPPRCRIATGTPPFAGQPVQIGLSTGQISVACYRS